MPALATRPERVSSRSGSARPAQFDRTAQHSRAMLGKIHVARKQLAMEEDDYRQIVFDQIGRTSLKGANAAELAKVLAAMEAKGFQPISKKPGAAMFKNARAAAQHPMARKARALWISLYHLGAVQNPAEAALEAFANRQLGCERLVWARQSDAFRLIEALKGMAARHGWPQHCRVTGRKLSPPQLQEMLCGAIMEKLRKAGAIPEDWSLNKAAERLCGFETDQPWTAETYAAVARMLGDHLRANAPL